MYEPHGRCMMCSKNEFPRHLPESIPSMEILFPRSNYSRQPPTPWLPTFVQKVKQIKHRANRVSWQWLGLGFCFGTKTQNINTFE